MKKKPTIYSLAKEFGVSAATVSRALNNSPELSANTIAKIQQRADELGFRTRQIASRTVNICALLQSNDQNHDLFSPYSIAVMRGMMNYLQPNNLEFSIFSGTASELSNGLLLRKLGQRNITGAVLINANKESRFCNELNHAKYPYCSLFTAPKEARHKLLTIDNVDVAYQAISYLIKLGHQKIGAIVTAPTGILGQNRRKGYRKAIQEAGLPFNPDFVCKTKQFGYEAGYRETLTLFQNHPELTALFVTGEEVAVGAMHALNELNRSIPKQVSLISCDDAPEVKYLTPPLTVVRIPNQKIGYLAAQWVHRMILGKQMNEPDHEPWMHGELIIRESTAPPPPPKG